MALQNITKETNKLKSLVCEKTNLTYSDGEKVADGDVIRVFGIRYDFGKIKWRINEVTRESEDWKLGEDVEIKKGNKQLVLQGKFHTKSNSEGFKDVEVVESSDIDKCKDKIKDIVVQLWYRGWPDVYIQSKRAVKLENLESNSIRPVEKDDFKITTIRATNKSMHLGWMNSLNGQRELYKLGVNWRTWHKMDATHRLYLLSHEIIHCYHSHHYSSFYYEHAQFVKSLMQSEESMNSVESLFEGEIRWNQLQALTLEGPGKQSQDIRKQQTKSVENVTNKMAEILSYDYENAKLLHLYPPERIHSIWFYEAFYVSDDLPKDEKNITPDYTEKVPINEVIINDSFSDKELFEYLDSIKVKSENGLTHYVYEESDMPIINDENEVIENAELIAAMRTIRYSKERVRMDEVLVKKK